MAARQRNPTKSGFGLAEWEGGARKHLIGLGFGSPLLCWMGKVTEWGLEGVGPLEPGFG